MHPFRFGVQLDGAATAAAWREICRKVEDLGYSTVLVPDHFGDQWAPTVALTAAAEATEKLKVGTLVYDNDYRHPVVLAKELATLDLMSEGRLEVGLGAGWMKTDYDESGIPYDEPLVRVKRFEEGVQIIRSLLVDGTCTFKGEFYEINAAQGLPRPHGTPPFVIGGGGKRVLSFAAQHADIIGVNANLRAGVVGAEVAKTVTADRFLERIGWIREAAGERFDSIELQVLTFMCAITDDRDGLAEQLGPLFGLDGPDALEVPMTVVGTVDQICDMLRERRERYGFSYYVFHSAEIEPFAPVVAALAGT